MPLSEQKPIDVSIRIKPLIPAATPFSNLSQSIERSILERCQSFATNIWSTNHSQAHIYDEFMNKQFLPSFNAGLNFTCFLYGQTGENQEYAKNVLRNVCFCNGIFNCCSTSNSLYRRFRYLSFETFFVLFIFFQKIT